MIYSYSQLGYFGALGNQLWEIASTIGIARKNYAEARFPTWAYEQCFSIPSHYFQADFTEGDIDLGGDYLQDLRHFEDDTDLVREYFQPSVAFEAELKDKYGDILQETSTKIAVHVRRANNLQLPNHHPVCSLDYFEQALDIMGVGKVVVFSDDITWCRQQSIFKDAYFAEGNDPSIDVMRLTSLGPLPLASAAMDFHLMAKMDRFIISNSSFSWWAAWLARGSVIYPSRWVGPALDNTKFECIFPHEWIKLDV